MKKSIYLFTLIFAVLFNCSSDDDSGEQELVSQDHIVEFTTGTLEGWVSVGLTTTLNYEDGTQEEINSQFDYVNNIVSVVIPENTSSFEMIFYIEDSSPANMKFYGAENNQVIHQEITSGMEFQYEYNFE